MTIQKFRNMDLLFVTIVALASDILLSIFGLIGLSVYLSIASPLIVISYMRWHRYGIFPNLVMVFAHLLIYGLIAKVGWGIALLHALSLISYSVLIIMINLTSQMKKRVGLATYFLIYTIGFLTVFLVEWVLLNLFGYRLHLLGHGFNQILNYLFGLGIIFITSLQKDILVNMNHFFLTKEKEVS